MTRWFFALCAAAVGLLGAQNARAAEDPVRERLQALHADWYDAAHDAWRAVDVRAPTPPRVQNPVLPGGSPLVTAVAWLLAALLLAALAWLMWQVIAREVPLALPDRQPIQPVRAGQAALRALDVDAADDPETALLAAKQTEDWSRAVVWLYAILLLRLDRAGVVRVRRGATNQRYRLEVADWTDSGRALQQSAVTLMPTVDAAIGAFERVYFGRQPADRELVTALETAIRATLIALPGEEAR